MSEASPVSPLRQPALRRIIAGYTVNRLGTWFGFVALSVAVFDHTHSALAVAALLVSAQVLPAFVVPAVVARIEASPRAGMLSALYALEAITTGAVIVVLWNFWLPAVLVLIAIDGTAALAASALLRAALARAARESAAAEHASDPGSIEAAAAEAEHRANATLNIAFSVTFVIGPAVAGAVVAAGGAATALAIDVGSFAICALILRDLRPYVEEGEGATVQARLRAAWSHIQAMPALRTLLVVQGIGLVFFESAAPIEVPYAKVALQAGDRGYGALLGSWGVGVVLGSLIFARLPARRLGIMLSGGTLAVGLGYLGFSVAPALAVACVAGLLGGIGNGVQWASVISAVQRLTPEPLLGRMMGAVEAVGALCPAVGLTFGGVLVATSSPRTAFLVTGLGAAITSLGFVYVARMGLDPVDSGPEKSETELTESSLRWSPFAPDESAVVPSMAESGRAEGVHSTSSTPQTP
ncbi:MAG TPA: MFS transporter [Solirubrobacteraceae bacterium]|jgi:hypothetical protein|nr:MFS transporter [Solirubrobacteraceae bacterium]